MYGGNLFRHPKKRLLTEINGSFDAVLSETDLGNVDALQTGKLVFE